MDSNHEEQIDKETLEKRSGGTGEETFIMENRRFLKICWVYKNNVFHKYVRHIYKMLPSTFLQS